LLSPSHTPFLKQAGSTSKLTRKCLPHSRMSQVKKRKCCCDRHEAGDHNPGRMESMDSVSDGSGDRLVAWIA
jgi:hypothetical protein